MKWNEFLNQTKNLKSEVESTKTELNVLHDRKLIMDDIRAKMIENMPPSDNVEQHKPEDSTSPLQLEQSKLKLPLRRARIKPKKRENERVISCGRRKLIIKDIEP